MIGDKKDVGMMSDILFILQNQVALEHHAVLSYAETKNELWIDVTTKVRQMRSQLLNRIIKEGGGQKYCGCKHASAIAMGYKEIGNRHIELGDKEYAKECFYNSAIFESLFEIIRNMGEKK